MKYALLIYETPDGQPAPDSPEAMELFGAWGSVTEALAPITAASQALMPGDTATTVRAGANGDKVLTDGPFAETKELLTGFYVIDVPDLDTATDWAMRLPNIPAGGSVEVRPVMEFDAE